MDFKITSCRGRCWHFCPGGTPYNGPYWEAPPEMGTFFTVQVYERGGISRVKVYEK